MDSIIEYLQSMLEFRDSGIYQFLTEVFGEFVIWLTVGAIKFKTFMVVFAWDVAQEILNSLNISSALQAAWGALDSKLLMMVTYLKIPDAINVLISARVTRYVLDIIGL